MSNLIIGFEFEFGWLPSTFPTKKPKSKPQFFQNFIFPEVKQSLDVAFETLNLEIKEDCTLSFHPEFKYWQTYYGVEVVSLPMEEKEAIEFLHKFISWLNTQSNIEINKTCSIHVNMSFRDKSLNKQVDYWQLLDNYPQHETLSLFNRQNNEYCKNSHRIKFGYEENNFVSKEKTMNEWIKQISSWKSKNKPIRKLKMIEKSFWGERYEFSKQDKKFETIQLIPEDMLVEISALFKKRINGLRKNVSIVLKGEDSPYFEFRMIGNVDYHKRTNDILTTIKNYRQHLLQSVVYN